MDSRAFAEIDVDKFAGAQLRTLRQKQGWSLQGVGDLLGVSYQQVRKYELGENRMSLATLYRLALVFSIDARYFLPDTEEAQHDRLRVALSLEPSIQAAAARISGLPPATRAAILTLIDDLSSRSS